MIFATNVRLSLKRCLPIRTRAADRGTTLVETMITSVVLLLVLGGLVTLLVHGARFSQAMAAATEVQDQALLASAAITRDLSEGSVGSFKVGSAPVGLIFGSTRGLDGLMLRDPDGRLLWRKLVCYYIEDVDGVPSLVRKEEALGAPEANPPAMTDVQTTAYFQSLSAPHELVARHVTGLSASGQSPVTVGLTVEKTVRGELYRVSQEFQVLLRN